MQLARRLLGIAFFVGFVVLIVYLKDEHSMTVTLRLPFMSGIEVALWVALLGTFGLGAVLTGTVAMLRATRQGLVARRYRRMIRDLEAEIHQLRNLPLSGDEPAAIEPQAADGGAPVEERALGRGA